jgi:hypothetical protein
MLLLQHIKVRVYEREHHRTVRLEIQRKGLVRDPTISDA